MFVGFIITSFFVFTIIHGGGAIITGLDEKTFLKSLDIDEEIDSDGMIDKIPIVPRYMTALYQDSKNILSDNENKKSIPMKDRQTIKSIPINKGMKKNGLYELQFKTKSHFDKFSGVEVLFKIRHILSNTFSVRVCFINIESSCFSTPVTIHQKQNQYWHGYNITWLLPTLSQYQALQDGLTPFEVNLEVYPSGVTSYEMNGSDKPQLILYTNEERYKILSQWKISKSVKTVSQEYVETKPRLARSTSGSQDDVESEPATCSLKDWTVNFDDVYWGHYIIAPKNYSARYCDGTCTRLEEFKKKTNHAQIRYYLIQQNTEGIPPPCCASSKLDSLNFLIRTNDGITLKEYPEMIVNDCACV